MPYSVYCDNCNKFMFKMSQPRVMSDEFYCSHRCMQAADEHRASLPHHRQLRGRHKHIMEHSIATRWDRVKMWLWAFLPDKCEMPGCKRLGVRGNENIVNGKVVCDYCHSEMMEVMERR